MEPPPLPSASGRFRLRVQIYPPQDVYNLSAAPLRQFTIVKTTALPLPDLTLQELCEEVVTRFKAIYPGESLFAIERPQDSYGSDLYLGDCVRDIFEDNEVFRVIKGATIRASVEPHRARSQSLQPNGIFQYEPAGPGKRSYGYSETGDSMRAPKRQRIVPNDPDRPLRSREHDTVENPGQHTREAIVIQDSQETTTDDSSKQAVNALNQVVSKSRQINSLQNSESALIDRQPSIPASTSSAPLKRIPSPPSISSSKDEVTTSGSDVRPPQSRGAARPKRKLFQVEEPNEQDGRESVSTAGTTPFSTLQLSNARSPTNGNKKLRRPTMRMSKTNAEYEKVSRTLPRKNVYEDIETDREHPSVRPTIQTVPLAVGDLATPIGVSQHKWKRQWSKTPSSDKSSPRRRSTAAVEAQDMRNSKGNRLDHEEKQQLQQECDRGLQVAKQQAEQERSKLAFEAAEMRRLEAEEVEKERRAELETERIAAEKLRQQKVEEERQAKLEKNRIAAEKLRHQEAIQRAKAEAEAEAEATRKRNALTKAKAEEAAQLRAKAREEEEAKAREAAEAEEKKAKERQDMTRKEMEAIQKADEEDVLKEQALLRSRQEREQRKQELLKDTIRRGGSTGSKPVTAHKNQPSAEKEPGETAITPASTTSRPLAGNKRGSNTAFIPRGRPSVFSSAPANASPRVPSPSVGLEAQMPLPPQLKRKVSFVNQPPSSGHRSSSVSTSYKQTTLVPPRIGITDVKDTPKHAPQKTYGKSAKPSKGKAKVVESPWKPPSPKLVTKSDEEIIADSSGSEYLENNTRAVGEPGPAYRKPVTRHASSPSNSEVSTAMKLKTGQHNSSVSEEAENSSSETSKPPTQSSSERDGISVQDDKASLSPEGDESLVRTSKSTPIPLPRSRIPASQRGSLTQIKESPKKADSLTSGTNDKADKESVEIDKENEAANDASEEESDSTETRNAAKPTNVLASPTEEQDRSPRLEAEMQNETTDEDSEEESDSTETHNIPKITHGLASAEGSKDYSARQKENVRDETTDEEQEEDSDDMQAEIDDQLLTQPLESASSLKRHSEIPIKSDTLSKGNMDANGLRNHPSGRPSLRRMNQEAQRTKQATLEAAKARGLERAQKMGHGVKRTGLLKENSESSLSEPSSEDDSGDEIIPRRTTINRMEVVQGDLDNEDVEELGQKLFAESKKPGKIGWGELGKQFTTNKHR